MSTPLGSCVQEACTLFLLSNPCFCSWLFRNDSWDFLVFLYLLSEICPDCNCTQLFLLPSSLFVFWCSRRYLNKGKHCSITAKGPSSQPVSISLLNRTAFTKHPCEHLKNDYKRNKNMRKILIMKLKSCKIKA